MFAIAFDMDIKELRSTYGEPYNNAYYDICIIRPILVQFPEVLQGTSEA